MARDMKRGQTLAERVPRMLDEVIRMVKAWSLSRWPSHASISLQCVHALRRLRGPTSVDEKITSGTLRAWTSSNLACLKRCGADKGYNYYHIDN